MSGVVRWRPKPRPVNARQDEIAAKWEPGKPTADLLEVARMAGKGADVAHVVVGGVDVLVARWLDIPDHHPAEWKYEVVEPGQWLAYSASNGFLYSSDDGGWRQFYERVES